MDTRYLIEKLGEALYTHAKEAKAAKEAAEAVDYLASVGVLGSVEETPEGE